MTSQWIPKRFVNDVATHITPFNATPMYSRTLLVRKDVHSSLITKISRVLAEKSMYRYVLHHVHATFASYERNIVDMHYAVHMHYTVHQPDGRIVIKKPSDVVDELYTIIVDAVVMYMRVNRALKILQKRFRTFYTTHIVRRGTIVLRNKKDGRADMDVEVVYNPHIHSYFEAALSGRYTSSLKDDKYVFRTTKHNTTQEAACLVLQTMNDVKTGTLALYAYLDENSVTHNTFASAFASVYICTDVFLLSQVQDVCDEYLQKYLRDTLYKTHGHNCLQRMTLFLNKRPGVASYLWKTTFATHKQREVLGQQLNISRRNMAGFVSSATLDDLRSFLERKLNAGKTFLDTLPPHLWTAITKAQEDLEKAKHGTRVGLYGRYISNDAIDAAQTRLHNAWKKADQWIGQQATHGSS